MKILPIYLSLLFVLFSTSSWAFQSPIEAYTFNIPELDSLVKKGKQQANEERFNAAIKTYQQLQQRCWDVGLDSVAIDLYEDIFDVHFLKMQGLAHTLAFIDSCKQQEADSSILGIYYAALAHNYLFYGEPDSMKKYYTLAVSLYTQQQRYMQLATLYLNIVSEFYFGEQISSALEYLQKAEDLIEKKLRPKNYYIPEIYHLQALIYFSISKYEKAIQSSLAMIKYDKNSGIASDHMLAYEYNNLGVALDRLNDYESAMDYYQAALSLTLQTQTKDPNKIAYLLINIGTSYGFQKKRTQERDMYLKGLDILLEIDYLDLESQEDFINACYYLANYYRIKKQSDSTIYYINQAYKINQVNDYRIYQTYELYGLYFLNQKNISKANSYAFKMLENTIKKYNVNSSEVGLSYELLATISKAEKNHLKALEYNQKALESLSPNLSTQEGFPNPILADISDKNLFLDILEHKMDDLRTLYAQQHPQVSQSDLHQTARLATETMEYISKGIKNKKSKQRWLTDRAIPVFEQAIQIALLLYQQTKRKAYLNEAFLLAERSKSMLLQEDFQTQKAVNLGSIPNHLILQEQSLQKCIADITKKRLDAKLSNNFDRMESLDSALFGYKHQLIELLHHFESEYPLYYQLKHTFKTTGIQEVQVAIDEQTILIEYFEGTKNIYVFSISKDTAFVNTIQKSDTYQADIANFRSTLVSIHATSQTPTNYYNKFIESAHKFYGTYLQNSLIPSKQRLIIIPDGHLSYLPFETFLTQEVAPERNQASKQVDYGQLPYLLLDYKISYNYSADLLIERQNPTPNSQQGQILGFAPSYAHPILHSSRNPYEQTLRKHLVDLPGASKELEFLQWHFKGSFWGGELATEAQLKKEISDYDILHFAVHGLVDNNYSDFSGLAFAEDGNDQEDNILYAYEIKQLDLNANLVVLSACETATGQYQAGEGILSLGRDFMYAGVPSILSTLWSLNDYSSAYLIKKFYTNLSLGMDKDEAIRKAKLDYLGNHTGISTHPALWACFVQIGNYNPIELNPTYNNAWLFGSIAILLVILSISFLLYKKRSRTVL
ncbi:CHAT domain-containing tetratricopeptide repeat protein [Aureispira sp. CCB-E]|uniref:CHAT domain-containing protein n=1 Tax=Aureispira sp. CCB-E TaxID=3051121 RepID=UPI0028686D37|nr:CHAT domain-containing tetratricopeptide repeat protein [Aureispira sp. CCB-E]WMX13386.1 CHAT domain-containing tetratricopeptide repeat protein [Aureispira sp. CCB-E]